MSTITSRSPEPIVRYYYGNNVLAGNLQLKQVPAVIRSPGVIISGIPYHGHRFIGEYKNDIDRDINPAISFFTGETPPQGYNVFNTGYFTVRSYIYEPNLFNATRYEQIS